MRAMVLAAGLGTRLRPLTDELPKPLVWIGDRPAIAWICGHLARAGIAEVVLNTHHLADTFDRELIATLPVRLSVFHEPEILGTAGGIANARLALGDDEVVVWNGDILADVDIWALGRKHSLLKGCRATLAVAPRPLGQGTLGLGADGQVVRLRGERFGDEVRSADFLGIQILSASLRAKLPKAGCLVGDVYLPALRRGEIVSTFEVSSPWDDVGTIDAYLDANLRWLRDRGLPLFVGEGATLGRGVEATGTIVGAGARVTGAGVLREVVVWPGAEAKAPLERAVVTTKGLVALGTPRK